ncbi:MAG TPA: xylose isomerase, partial [Roseateles sp.]|nr:xylose isomerase [Roseateles sp.]
MSTAYSDLPVVKYEGTQSTNPLAYRWYDAKRVVLGKTLAEHLRPAVCYWHNFCWKGEDVFGLGNTVFQREWFNEADPVKAAYLKLDAAFDFFGKLGLPYWCFHDRDVAPEGANLAESNRILDGLLEAAAKKMQDGKVQLLWGTANLFSNG